MVYNPAASAFAHSKFLRHEKSVEIEFMVETVEWFSLWKFWVAGDEP
jgi:hypothetical protein